MRTRRRTAGPRRSRTQKTFNPVRPLPSPTAARRTRRRTQAPRLLQAASCGAVNNWNHRAHRRYSAICFVELSSLRRCRACRAPRPAAHCSVVQAPALLLGAVAAFMHTHAARCFVPIARLRCGAHSRLPFSTPRQPVSKQRAAVKVQIFFRSHPALACCAGGAHHALVVGRDALPA
jgi:hypothetical protein